MAEATRPSYPAHLSSEVSSFDGILPQQRLGELSHAEQLRLFRLNGVPNRPCSARFSLPDNSIDSKTLLDKIVSMGIPKSHVSCIQRFRTGQVDVTFTSTQDRELFLSKVALVINQRPATIRPAYESTLFVTVREAPWELPDDLIVQRLGQFGSVYSIRRAFNQSLLPEKVHDGRRVLRMTLRHDIPCFMKFGPFLLRIFYPGQPKVCWKCTSPDHIGRECPSDFCFNCDHSGHQAHGCEERIKCSLCKSDQHLAVDCPGNWGRRTLAQRTPQRSEPPGENEDTPLDLDAQQSEETGASSDSELASQSSESQADDEPQDDEVSDSISEFTSPEPGTDPPLQQRKRGGRVEDHVKKKSRIEETHPP